MVLLLAGTTLFGCIVVLLGSAPAAALATVSLAGALTVASNLKRRVLGEPLLFSDLAVAQAFLRYPRFYVASIPLALRAAILLALPVLVVAAILLSRAAWPLRVDGAALGFAAASALGLALRRQQRQPGLTRAPEPATYVRRYGLVATLLAYALAWRRTPDPPPPPNLAGGVDTPALVIVVQCESFADPADLIGASATRLPSLAACRRLAIRSGRLLVSGFGAYTMRTEYGVLFGRSEDELGFRRFDPYLTARREVAHALPNKLRAWGFRSVFLHPHDLRFYGRDRLMPLMGFDEVIGPDAFAPVRAGTDVSDLAVGDMVHRLMSSNAGRTLIYAVTMENHGPWSGAADGTEAAMRRYLHHLGHSDALLGRLADAVLACDRPALLVFFGDHRPSLPGHSAPYGARDTPYVVLGSGLQAERAAPENLSPAALHHLILKLCGGALARPAPDAV